jgi:hypothetical protein
MQLGYGATKGETQQQRHVSAAAIYTNERIRRTFELKRVPLVLTQYRPFMTRS